VHADPASIVGPPFSAPRISASMAACTFGRGVLGFRQLCDVAAALFKVTSFRPLGSGTGSSDGVDQGKANFQKNKSGMLL
jgi:hypothetical protein